MDRRGRNQGIKSEGIVRGCLRVCADKASVLSVSTGAKPDNRRGDDDVSDEVEEQGIIKSI